MIVAVRTHAKWWSLEKAINSFIFVERNIPIAPTRKFKAANR